MVIWANLIYITLKPGLANGEIHVLDGRTNWGARVKYKCKKDYSLSGGEDERVCLENGWSGQAPECVYTKCPGESRLSLKNLDTWDIFIIWSLGNSI